MIIQNITVGTGDDTILLGKRGETLATQIRFDITALKETYGDGSATLFAKRNGDEVSYPVATEREGDIVSWTVNNADTAIEGFGRAELFWYVDEALAKSIVYMTQTDPDIGAEGEAPEPYESWAEQLIEDVTAIKDDAKDYADDAKNSADAAEQAKTDTQGLLATTLYIDNSGILQIHG